MKNARIRGVWDVLNQLSECKHAKLAYAISRNLNLLEGPLQALEKSRKRPIDGDEEWGARRKEIILEHCLRDKRGNPIIEGKQYLFDNPDSVENILDQVKQKEFPDYYAEEKVRDQEYQELLEEEAEILGFPYKIKWSFIKVNEEGEMADLNAIQLAVLTSVGIIDGDPPWLDEEDQPASESDKKEDDS